ncbi:MAG: helix-turn-helix domain-containing protein [Deltaproteobacteria bacterium]|nr:helix-turn-helix domain-containing protein [Deltaproteobacteria bacterium]
MQKISDAKRQKIILLIQGGKTIRQTASVLNISHTTVERYLKKAGIIRRPVRRWTELEKEIAIKLYSMGKSYDYIARRLNRSQNAVEIFFSRRRAAIRGDPEKQQVLKVLSFCMNPARILKIARKTGFLNEIKRREEEI